MNELIEYFNKKNIEIANLLIVSNVDGLEKKDLYNNGEVAEVDFDTPLRQASVSKLFIVVGIAKLIDESLLSLNSSVSEFTNISNNSLTIKRLLSHTSGINDNYGYIVSKEEAIDIANKFDDLSDYCYSNLNYVLLAIVIENIVKKPFDVYIEELMRLHDVECSYNPNKFNEIGFLYRKTEMWNKSIDESNVDYEKYSIGKKSPQGGIKISINELSKFAYKLINNTLVSKKTLDSLLEYIEVTVSKDGTEYCKTLHCCNGLHILNIDKVSEIEFSEDIIYGHFGYAYGLRAGLFFNNITKNYFIYFYTGTNVEDDAVEERFENKLYNVFDAAVFEYIRRTYESI